LIPAVAEGAALLAAPAQPRPRGLVDGMLTDPHHAIDEALRADAAGQSALARVLLLVILAGTAGFGAAVGFTRGGLQVLFAAIKLPLVVLVTASVTTPALTGLGLALGRPAELRGDLIRVLAALARGSLVLAALAPVMLVATCLSVDYHWAVLMLVGCCLLAGAAGLPILARALWVERRGRFFLMFAMLIVVTLAGTQTSWLLRPYLVSPQTSSVPFVRALEGSFSDSVRWHLCNAAGADPRCLP
jgi:hypothetical protein